MPYAQALDKLRTLRQLYKEFHFTMKKLGRKSILNRIIYATIIMLFIPLVVVNILTYRLNYRVSLDKEVQVNEEFLSIGLDLMEEYLIRLRSLPMAIYETPHFLNLLQQEEEYTPEELFFLRQELNQMIGHESSVRMITLETRNGMSITQEEIGSDNEKHWRAARYDMSNGSLQSGYDMLGNPTVLRYKITVQDVPFKEDLATLTFYSVTDTLSSIASKVGSNQEQGVFVQIGLSGESTPLYRTRQINSYELNAFAEGYARGQLDGESGFFFIGRCSHRNMHFEIMKFVPEQLILGPINTLLWHMLALQIVILASALIFLYYIYRIIIAPIKNIATNIDKVKEGEYSYKAIHHSDDEVGVLDHKYEEMVETINNLVNETLKSALEISKARLKMLQAQINPHFLNNMLQTISTQALLAGDSETSETITMLARFFQYNLDTSSEFVPISEELRHIERYLNLQKARFREKLRYNLDCEEELLHTMVPKMILQPLVENSLQHGLTSGDEGGLVQVHIYKKEDQIVIVVTDNGSGFSKEKIEKLKQEFYHYEITSEAGHGIGFLNVLQRLSIYTTAFQWDIISKPWEETQIHMEFSMHRVNGLSQHEGEL